MIYFVTNINCSTSHGGGRFIASKGASGLERVYRYMNDFILLMNGSTSVMSWKVRDDVLKLGKHEVG